MKEEIVWPTRDMNNTCVTPPMVYQDPRLDTIIPVMHLQWFAAEDEGRTFDPTERKIQKAREEGKVAKTQEIPSSLLLIAISSFLWLVDTYYLDTFKDMFTSYFMRIDALGEVGFSNEVLSFLLFMARLLWPILLLSIVFSILGNILQFGWVVSTKPITPDFSRVNFKVNKWIEKIISVQGWYNTSTSLLKIIVVSIIIIVNIAMKFNEIAGTVNLSFEQGLSLCVNLIFSVLLQSGVFLLVLAMIDYQFQRYLFTNELKMSFQDIKEEFKETEGDVEVKKRIQERMQEYTNRNIKKNVADSDVLVTNPTHIAVAMKYNQKTMLAPKIMAKGEDQFALRMKRYAKDADVPIIENKPLARALYADLRVGDEIPEKYYSAVVLIFEQVYKMKGAFEFE